MNVWVSSALLLLYLSILGLVWIVWSTELVRRRCPELGSFLLGLSAALVWPVSLPCLLVWKAIENAAKEK